MIKRLLVGLCCLSAVVLLGCGTQSDQRPEQILFSETTEAALPPVPTITLPEVRRQWIIALRHAGVKVFHVGETYHIIIPTEQLFAQGSVNYIEGSKFRLTVLSRLIESYHKVLVTVKGHADCGTCFSAQHERALSQAQAHAVSDYLWACGIDTRLLVSKGQGSTHSISADASTNSRVEVWFKYLPHA